MAANVVPITSLSPTSTPPADAAIRAVVSLIWPYSSSTKQCAVLLSDPDFRLRTKKGQVRVRFYGPSAEAVALGKLGIGDDVLLELRGASWAECGESSVRTPGRSIDGELAYTDEVGLQKAGGDWIRAIGSEFAPVQESTQLPIVQNGGRGRAGSLIKSEVGAFGGAIPIYSSPTFVRRARLSGSGFGYGYDLFAEDEDLDVEGPRKRARTSFEGVGKWRLAGRTPSPEKKDSLTGEFSSAADADMVMKEGAGPVEDGQDEFIQPKTLILDSAEASGMAPPSLPLLEVASQSGPQTERGAGPATTNLEPVPFSTLPLPSPLPAVGLPLGVAVEPSTTAAAAAMISATASSSQLSLGPSQSLPDTADPDDADLLSPTGIYAHDGPIEGTYREHVANTQWLSDTEEDEGLHEEHMRKMRKEDVRDAVINDDDALKVREDDVDEVIDDREEEPEASSDEDDDAENIEVERNRESPAVVEIDDETPESDEHHPEVESASRHLPALEAIRDTDAVEKATRHEAPPNDDNNSQQDGGTQQQLQLAEGAAKPSPKAAPFTISIVKASKLSPDTSIVAATATSQKREASPLVSLTPETPTKIPAGMLGLDVTSSTPQTTPQSERERVMARTYHSLFGFNTLPVPLLPIGRTSSASDEPLDMGRVKTATGAMWPGTLMTQAKETDADVADGNQVSSDVALSSVNDAPEGPSRLDQSAQPTSKQDSTDTNIIIGQLHQSSVSLVLEGDQNATEADLDPSTLPDDDMLMADASSISVNGEPIAIEQSAPVGDTPAAMLEAAIQGDVDVASNASEAIREDSRHDHDIIAESSGKPNTVAIDDSYSVVPEYDLPTAGSVDLSLSAQVEIIEIDSSDGMNGEEGGTSSHELPHGDIVNTRTDVLAPIFSGSRTEVDFDEENIEPDTELMSSAPQAAAAEMIPPNRVITETRQAQDVQSILAYDSEPIGPSKERASSKALQNQDLHASLASDQAGQASSSNDQQQHSDVPAVVSTPPKNASSFHYFSSQSPISAASSSSAHESEPSLGFAVSMTKPETKIIELSSSSPAPELGTHQAADPTVQLADIGTTSVDDEEHMSNTGSLSPGSSVAQHAMIDAGKYRETDLDDAEERLYFLKADERLAAAKEASNALEDDEQMSEAELPSPRLSETRQTSLHMPDAAFQSATAKSASDSSDPSPRDSERLHGVTPAISYQALPVSPEDSQNTFEMQHFPPARQVKTSHLPPTPQLTQGDSLIKEVQVIVEPAKLEASSFDPPSQHTRSSVDPTILEEERSEKDTSHSPSPSQHTISSVEPAAFGEARSSNATPDPPSRHTRSSVGPIAAETGPARQTTPDPPSRHTRSSVEPTAAGTGPARQTTPDPPFRYTRSSVGPDNSLHSSLPRTPAPRSTRRSQTHNRIPVESIQESQLEEEERDTIAVLSPLTKTPARKAPRKVSKVTMKDDKMNEDGESPQIRSPAKKSLTSRLSNVPDVISAWFTPRRSTRQHAADEEADVAVTPKQPAFMGLSTAMGYYTPLSNVNQKMNSQVRTDNTVDAIAIVVDSTKAPERAKAGPKDYYTCFKIWDPSLELEMSVLVETFRPWKAMLPMAEVGDVILLRGFAVKSRKGQPYLISSETSSWCVWRYGEHDGNGPHQGKHRTLSFSGIREEIKGPPVELGQEERDRVVELRQTWEEKF